MYDSTAFLYDAVAACEQPEMVSDTVQRLLNQYGLSAPALLGDLGAGTGLMSILLAKSGWCLYAVELSSAMLAVAQEKALRLHPDVQARLTWIQEDITRFRLPNGLFLDAAVCLHNTLNHLPEWSQVEQFVKSAYLALRPGGVLIVDSDTLSTFLQFFNHGPVVVWDDGMHRLTRECAFDETTGRARHIASLEAYLQGGLQLVSKEAMPLQYHPESELFSAFSAAGFQVLSAEPYNPNPTLYSGDFIAKVLWVLRKPL